MSIRDYYHDSIHEPVVLQGWHFRNLMICFNVKKLVTEIADSVETAMENEGMASGRDCIPNPLASEVTAQKRYRADDAKEFDKERERHEQDKEDLRYEIRRLRWKLEESAA